MQPDCTILFDVAPEVAAQRLAAARQLDRFEKENLDFFTRVRNAYLTRARQNPERFLIVNTDRDREVISKELSELFSTWG